MTLNTHSSPWSPSLQSPLFQGSYHQVLLWNLSAFGAVSVLSYHCPHSSPWSLSLQSLSPPGWTEEPECSCHCQSLQLSPPRWTWPPAPGCSGETWTPATLAAWPAGPGGLCQPAVCTASVGGTRKSGSCCCCWQVCWTTAQVMACFIHRC